MALEESLLTVELIRGLWSPLYLSDNETHVNSRSSKIKADGRVHIPLERESDGIFCLLQLCCGGLLDIILYKRKEKKGYCHHTQVIFS